MIGATLDFEARALGLHAPALALVRRVTVLPDDRGFGAVDCRPAALDGHTRARLSAGAPFPADRVDPSGAWGPDGRTLDNAGTPPDDRWNNITRACLRAAVEAGLPLFVQDADRLLAPLHLGAADGGDAIDLTCGDRLLCRLATDGARLARDDRVGATTTRVLLFVPGNATTTPAETRAVCIRAVRLMRETSPEVYAQIVPLYGPAEATLAP
jgi:hypothetical protein